MTVSYGFVFLVKVLPREGCPSSTESLDEVNKWKSECGKIISCLPDSIKGATPRKLTKTFHAEATLGKVFTLLWMIGVNFVTWQNQTLSLKKVRKTDILSKVHKKVPSNTTCY